MKSDKRMRIVLWRMLQAGIIFLTVLGYVKGIFISLDIDESYAVAQGYRLAMGDRLFVDMWEPHQLSAFLSAAFTEIYLRVFQTTDYLVIYLRIVGMLIHTGFGMWLYQSLKGKFKESILFLVVSLHMNFFPKWVQMPEFELMHYWFLMAIFLLLYPYFTEGKYCWLRSCLAGVCLVGCMMSYPTMILLYPVYLVGLPVLEGLCNHAKGIKKLQSVLGLTLGAVVSGGMFLMYLLSYQTWEEFWQNVLYIFMDESHATYTMAQKFNMYAEQIKEMWDIYYESLLWSAIVVAIVAVGFFVLGRVRNDLVTNLSLGKKVEIATLTVFILSAIVLQKDYALGSLLEDQNQFYLQVRYVAVIIPAVYLGIRYHKRMAIFFWLSVIPALISLLAVLFVTNMGINVACSKGVLGIYGSLMMLCIYIYEEIAGQKFVWEFITYGMGLALLLGFLVCRVVLIRVTGCLPVTVMAPMERMEYGPEKGIYVLDEQAQIWNENYPILKELIEENDRLLFIGAENLVYPAAGCLVCTPSTQGTTVFNEIFMQYYEKHPDKLPNIVVQDKTFETDPVYRLFSDTGIVMDWIGENYPNAREWETSHMKILFLEE